MVQCLCFFITRASPRDHRWKHPDRHCGGPQRLGGVRVPGFGQKWRRSGRTEPGVGQDQDGGCRSSLAHIIHPDVSPSRGQLDHY